MQNESSKNIIFGIILSLVLVVSILSFSYALFMYSRTSSTGINLKSGKIVLGYVDNKKGISLSNALPTNDSLVFNNDNENNYFDFHITYDITGDLLISYEIDIYNDTSSLDEVASGNYTSLPTSSVKIALYDLDNSNFILNDYFSNVEKVAASNDKRGNYLYSKFAMGQGRDNYRLYMWIPERDASSNEINPFGFGENSIKDKTFSIKIDVQAIAEEQD